VRRELRREFWRLIGAGWQNPAAAKAVGASEAAGLRWFTDAGGMPPFDLVEPSGRYLCFAEREEIAILWAQKCSVREIARRLGRAPSTISRELHRNAATRGGRWNYRASTAQWHAERRAARPKVSKLSAHSRLRGHIQAQLSGRGGGALSRSAVDWNSTSPKMSRCGYPTKRSTRRCMSRAAVLCGAS